MKLAVILFLLIFAFGPGVDANENDAFSAYHGAGVEAYKQGKLEMAERQFALARDEASQAPVPTIQLQSAICNLVLVSEAKSDFEKLKVRLADLRSLSARINENPKMAPGIEQCFQDSARFYRQKGINSDANTAENDARKATYSRYKYGSSWPWVYISGGIILLGFLARFLFQRCRRLASDVSSAESTSHRWRTAIRAVACWFLAFWPIALSDSLTQGLNLGHPLVVSNLLLFPVLLFRLTPAWVAIPLWILQFILEEVVYSVLYTNWGETSGGKMVQFLVYWYLIFHRGKIKLNRAKSEHIIQDN